VTVSDVEKRAALGQVWSEPNPEGMAVSPDSSVYLPSETTSMVISSDTASANEIIGNLIVGAMAALIGTSRRVGAVGELRDRPVRLPSSPETLTAKQT